MGEAVSSQRVLAMSAGLSNTTFNQVPRTGHPAGGSQRLGPYGTGPHYRVTTPWATDAPNADRVGGSLGATESQVSPHKGSTCEKFGTQILLRGNLDTVDIESLREALLQYSDPSQLNQAFQVFDHDHKGTITAAQFRRTADAVMPNLPGWASSQMMLLGIGGSGLFYYDRVLRALDFKEGLPQPQAAPSAASTARAAGTSGDIIGHRDGSHYEEAPSPAAMTGNQARTARALAASTSGDIVGHTSPIRSADLAWDMKGRVGPGGKAGSALEYGNAGFNCVHEKPGSYSAYRNAGDIIANTDFRMEAERKMFPSLRKSNQGSYVSQAGPPSSPLC